ncbi:MAG: hypothetical protein WB020_00570 [Candidatus Dormiibacterota bacterium]
MRRLIAGMAVSLTLTALSIPSGRPLRSSTLPVVALPSGAGQVLLRDLESPDAAILGGRLYVWQQTGASGPPDHTALMRVSPGSGRILAIRQLGRLTPGTGPGTPLALAGGWLRAAVDRTTGGGPGGWLLRIQPRTLTVRSRTSLPELGFSPTTALASGWIWVGGGGRLYRVSPKTGRVSGSVKLGGATNSSFVSARRDRELLVTEAENGWGSIELRSATDGALVRSTTTSSLGVFAPRVSQLVDGAVWLSGATGMAGYVERLDATTLDPTPLNLPYPPRDATNGISAQFFAGVLYIQEPGGGRDFNYCGKQATGRFLAPSRLPDSALLVTANSTDLFYLRGDSSSRREELVRAPVNELCRG